MPPFYVKDYEARRIPLPKYTLDILTELQAHAAEQIPYVLLDESHYQTMVTKWQRYQKQNLEWQNQNMANNVLREFRRHLKWAQIKAYGSLSIHTLRKSCGQNWANHLPINVVKELMGHSSIATTEKFYNQVDDDHRAKAAAVIDLLISSNDRKEKLEKTDVRLTSESYFGQDSTKAQS